MSRLPDNNANSAGSLSPQPGAVHEATGPVEELFFEDRPLMGGRVGVAVVLIFLGLILLGGPVFYYLALHRWPTLYLLLAMVVGGLLLLVIPFIVSHSIRYRVTNQRIDRERGFFSKTIDSIEMWHVEDVALRQSIIGRMLGVGTIHVVTNDPTIGKLSLLNVRNPVKLFKALEQVIIAVKRGGGVLKIDPGV